MHSASLFIFAFVLTIASNNAAIAVKGVKTAATTTTTVATTTTLAPTTKLIAIVKVPAKTPAAKPAKDAKKKKVAKKRYRRSFSSAKSEIRCGTSRVSQWTRVCVGLSDRNVSIRRRSMINSLLSKSTAIEIDINITMLKVFAMA